MLLFGGGRSVRASRLGLAEVGGDTDGGERGGSGPGGRPPNGLGSILATAQVVARCKGGVLSVHEADRRLSEILDLSQLSREEAEAVLALEPEPDSAGLDHDSSDCRVFQAPGLRLGGAGRPEADGRSAGGSVFQLILDRDIERTWLLTLVRDRIFGPFSAQEITVLSSLGPAFRAVLRQERGFHRLAAMSDIISGLLDYLAFGTLLIDADRCVLWSNAASRAMLAGSEALQVGGQRLKAADPRSNMRLREIVHELSGARPGAGRALALPADGGPPLQMCFIRLSGSSVGDFGAVIAVFVSSSGSAEISGAFLRDLYNLTPVEADIARLICHGLAPADAAERLRLSIHTVRDYLKPIFQKMGVRRQTDMVRVAATFAGVFNGERSGPPSSAGTREPSRTWN